MERENRFQRSAQRKTEIAGSVGKVRSGLAALQRVLLCGLTVCFWKVATCGLLPKSISYAGARNSFRSRWPCPGSCGMNSALRSRRQVASLLEPRQTSPCPVRFGRIICAWIEKNIATGNSAQDHLSALRLLALPPTSQE